MHEVIGPVNLVAAALITQLSLAAIVFLAVLVLQSGDLPVTVSQRPARSVGLHLVTLAAALITVGLLVFSDEYSTIWRPLFGTSSHSGVPWSWALFFVFLLNILWITVLVVTTGGSESSPFGPIYFLLPALAIFLREPLHRAGLYLLLIVVSFTLNFFIASDKGKARGGRRRPYAYWFVSVACFALATFVGYVTRPR
ncbi:MAG: hypothetical protein NTX17_05840 [Candidatus Eisenbacteria bacterium]|nr:hypothetical protein [Candidatus Eisenbacteria bacterium]